MTDRHTDARRSGRREVTALLRLGIPAALTQVGAMTLGLVDTMMVGRVGVAELDAAALGNLVGMGTLIFGIGIVFGMDPVAAQAAGAGRGREVGRTLQRAVVISTVLAVPIMALWSSAERVLTLAAQDPALARAAGEYLAVQIWSVAPFLWFTAMRQYLQARGMIAPGLWVVLGANVFNAGANWVLIFGHAGFPPLGLHGAAIATAGTRVFQCIALAAWIFGRGLHRGGWTPLSWAALRWRGLLPILGHGLPLGLQFGLEMWAFHGATMMAGWLGPTPLAAHTIALNLATLSFMLPLGMSIAATTRVGNLLGAGDPVAARRSGWLAMHVSALLMVGMASVFVGLRDVLPALFTGDATVVAATATLLPIAAAFQLADGTQVVGTGILRAMGSTRIAAVLNLVGYYAIALPLGFWLAFRAGCGVGGLWWGLAVGLLVVAGAMIAWLARRGPGVARRASRAKNATSETR